MCGTYELYNIYYWGGVEIFPTHEKKNKIIGNQLLVIQLNCLLLQSHSDALFEIQSEK
ncbi:MAG: hypothetical protein BWY67_01150 [Bacteroidetes bacterium ADurb.Bin397]|nr:MAG: hypothetical protein BWY67_01150 [Bacteroidetes bacterium ADurb.Bin397]